MIERNGCPERALEPRESGCRKQVNRLAYMREDRDDFSAWAAGRMDYFGDLFRTLLAEMDARLAEERAYLDDLKRQGARGGPWEERRNGVVEQDPQGERLHQRQSGHAFLV